jgi:DNA-directed RNA polymerase omega subunit
LNDAYLNQAIEQIDDRNVLVRIASERAKDLAHGSAPMVEVNAEDKGNYLDIALKEIGAGKVVVDDSVLLEEE